jgi:thioredoxin reductase
VDIPRVQENFETNIDGIYIVGELGGMGLIRNAFEQGRQCIDYISNELKQNGADAENDMLDLVIVGCGPAGLSSTIHAKRKGMKFVTLEREDVGGTVRYYPRKKLVMTQPLKIPGIGKIHKNEILKEELIELWVEIIQTHELNRFIKTGQNVEAIDPFYHGFRVRTTEKSYKTRKVILAIGRRGTPRKLNIAGEELQNVAYSLVEPDHYNHEKITVVGGGDSAIEAAMSLSEQEGNSVTLSYRKAQFTRIKPANSDRLTAAVDAGSIDLLLNSNVIENSLHNVAIQLNDGKIITKPNDSLFIFAGGVLPNAFLKETGIKVDTKFGQSK